MLGTIDSVSYRTCVRTIEGERNTCCCCCWRRRGCWLLVELSLAEARPLFCGGVEYEGIGDNERSSDDDDDVQFEGCWDRECATCCSWDDFLGGGGVVVVVG